MVLKSYAKINLSLSINRKLPNGLHEIQSIYCLVDLHDSIRIKKDNKKFLDDISFTGTHSKHLSKLNNSVSKCINLLRKNGLISDYYSVRINKKIPVFAGFGGGSSNAVRVINHLTKNKIDKKLLNKMYSELGSDLRLFYYNRGFLKNLKTVKKINKSYNFYFLLVYPSIKCSTKEVYSKVKKYTKKQNYLDKNFNKKNDFINYLKNCKNDLQSIVEKKHPIIKNLLKDISEQKGCCFSRMTGSGSACYGLFSNKDSSKVALKKLRKRYPKFLISLAKTI
mgnify:CR=1 FL=1